MKIFNDIFNYFEYKKNESNFRVGFFAENKFVFEYLKPYILNKLKKQKILILSFEELSFKPDNKTIVYTFHTNFFRQLVFLTLKLKYLYSSTPDLNQTIFKKSKLSNCKYIYLQHSPASLTMIYRSDAFDAFDAVQTIHTYQFNEMQEIITKKNLKSRAFKGRYLFLDKILKSKNNSNLDLLIAPSWNSNFYKLNCHIILNELLLKNKINYEIRPHPMSLKADEVSLENFKKLNIKYNISNEFNLNNYKYLISDWSGVYIEFAILTKRKALLINTPKKILNKDYTNFSQTPIEIDLRNIFGKTFEVNELEKLVFEIKKKKSEFSDKSAISEAELIQKYIKEIFYDVREDDSLNILYELKK